jgi:hypothetical protein
MDNNKKIVTQLPLTNLWSDNEVIYAVREKYLTLDNIQEMLIKHPIEFVIADIGQKLEWISYDKSFDFWKTELKPHLANDINKMNIDNFVDNYAYVASKWTGELEKPIILLEKYH